MDNNLNGKTAIVCGSTDGIGKASALLMAERGASITLVARNKEKLNATLTELSTEHGQNHATVCADFNKPDELKQMMREVIDERMDEFISAKHPFRSFSKPTFPILS